MRTKVTNGRVTPLFYEFLAKNEGKDIELTFKPYRPIRSNNQNKYYWGVVVPMLANELGYTNEEMHDALKYKFLREDYDNGLSKVTSTTELNTEDFNHFITMVQVFASELGIIIPDPNQ